MTQICCMQHNAAVKLKVKWQLKSKTKAKGNLRRSGAFYFANVVSRRVTNNSSVDNQLQTTLSPATVPPPLAALLRHIVWPLQFAFDRMAAKKISHSLFICWVNCTIATTMTIKVWLSAYNMLLSLLFYSLACIDVANAPNALAIHAYNTANRQPLTATPSTSPSSSRLDRCLFFLSTPYLTCNAPGAQWRLSAVAPSLFVFFLSTMVLFYARTLPATCCVSLLGVRIFFFLFAFAFLCFTTCNITELHCAFEVFFSPSPSPSPTPSPSPLSSHM